ncbi:MAG: ASCH domain-containing protein [Intrasporangium sp.]|uniref:ASCH domain-containing protein n=1 Tax=Intrasporangium sp. TaxID=1925024 RepID=UPI0026499856|nr:ASCH domain-containing protein [Intrasporangium sp.]MDN5795722.1 ASCH domain-containing protein [Intrasporangium sp.]
MLISKPVAEGIRAGSITQAFRRWDAPRVKIGGTQLTAAGVIRFDACREVRDLDRLTERDAKRAGVRDLAALRRALEPRTRKPSARGSHGGDTVYRVTLSWVGADPRVALRDSIPDADELAGIDRRLARLDARQSGPWTREILTWIRDNPRVVSKELAALRGVELLPMKTDIRKLKALGLTISHDVGYELSPRGAAYLAWCASEPPTPRTDRPRKLGGGG